MVAALFQAHHSPRYGAQGNARSTWSSRAMKSAAQRRPSRYTQAPVVISSAPNTVTCRFVPGVGICGRTVRSVQLARTCGSRFRCVSSSASTNARRGSPASRGHDLGHHMIMGGIAAGNQPGPPPDRHHPDPPVQRPRADRRPA